MYANRTVVTGTNSFINNDPRRINTNFQFLWKQRSDQYSIREEAISYYYNLEAISLTKEMLSHLSFVSNAIYSKIFKTFDKTIIAECSGILVIYL